MVDMAEIHDPIWGLGYTRDTHPWSEELPHGNSSDHGLKYATSNEVGNAGGYEIG